MFHRTTRFVLALLAIAPAACSSSAPDGGGANASAGDMPSVHIEQTIYMESSGKPQDEMAYRQMLADCGRAGTPTTPIPDSDVGRIGRKKLVETIEGNRSSRRVDAWKVDASVPCQFKLVHEGTQDIQAADGKGYHVDLATNTGDVQDNGAPAAREPVDDGDLDAAAKAARWTRGGKGNVQGAACETWVAPTGDQYCVWSEGEKWGFSRAGVNALDGDGVTSDGAIVLKATPPATGYGWNVQTDTFTVGKAADESTFAPPANARMASN